MTKAKKARGKTWSELYSMECSNFNFQSTLPITSLYSTMTVVDNSEGILFVPTINSQFISKFSLKSYYTGHNLKENSDETGLGRPKPSNYTAVVRESRAAYRFGVHFGEGHTGRELGLSAKMQTLERVGLHWFLSRGHIHRNIEIIPKTAQLQDPPSKLAIQGGQIKKHHQLLKGKVGTKLKTLLNQVIAVFETFAHPQTRSDAK
uniref:Uncharacterized protein n=1 Tax=Strigamia maritima TaxID=126957 RepID=T1JCL8_STRMM